MRMRVLALVLGFVSVTVMAQTAPLQKLPPPPPPPPPTAVLRGATADTISVPINVLEGLAVSEPDISARDEAPQPGIVSLRVLVSKTGTVEEVAVQLGQGELPRVAVAGVKGWTYRPYLVDGQPREIQSTILLYFRDGVGKRMPAVAGMGGVAGMSGLGAPAPVVARAPGPDGRVAHIERRRPGTSHQTGGAHLPAAGEGRAYAGRRRAACHPLEDRRYRGPDRDQRASAAGAGRGRCGAAVEVQALPACRESRRGRNHHQRELHLCDFAQAGQRGTYGRRSSESPACDCSTSKSMRARILQLLVARQRPQRDGHARHG